MEQHDECRCCWSVFILFLSIYLYFEIKSLQDHRRTRLCIMATTEQTPNSNASASVSGTTALPVAAAGAGTAHNLHLPPISILVLSFLRLFACTFFSSSNSLLLRFAPVFG
ncbi:hypothetical protein BJ741DRAFT_105575 [Chytriomyces cf. hyalinus JEL632]|nr:hypothetical protein BJ741DRAFT_105575 [Chytriomyces cf. hyalinus JEL632]